MTHKEKILVVLRENGQMRTQDIARCADLQRTNTCGTLARMEKDGLVEHVSRGLWAIGSKGKDTTALVPDVVVDKPPVLRMAMELKHNLYDLMKAQATPIDKRDIDLTQDMKGGKGVQVQYVSINTNVLNISVDCLQLLDCILEELG
jgi:hypothetical protein